MPTLKKKHKLLTKKISWILQPGHWEHDLDTEAFYFFNKEGNRVLSYLPEHDEILVFSQIALNLRNRDTGGSVFKQKINKKFGLGIKLIF